MRSTTTKLLIVVAISACAAFAADVRLGTWKFNAAKSKSTAANPVKSQVDVREATPDGKVKITRNGQLADGTGFSYTFSIKYDGREYPVKGAPFDMIAVKRIDANTTSYEASKTKGKYLMKGVTEVSRDARTLTQTSKGTDSTGKMVETTAVFDRQ